MKKTLLRLFYLASVVVLVVACNKDKIDQDTATPQALEKPISVVNGRLVFSSKESFEATIGTLKKQQNQLRKWESQFDGFTSMNTAYENLTESDFEKMAAANTTDGYENIITFVGVGEQREAVINIEDPLMASLVNKDGLLQIGEDVYKINYDQVVKVKVSDINKLEGARLSNKNASLEVLPVTHTVLSEASSPNGRIAEERVCTQEYRTSGGIGGIKKRLVGEIYATTIGVLYSGVGARTKHQQRIGGVWFRKRTNQIRLTVTGQFVYYGVGSRTENVNYDSGIQTDDGRDAYTFRFCFNASCEFKINYANSTHYALCDDGRARQCNLSW